MTVAYVLLDRDGVINYDSEDYIKSPEEWIPLPNSLEAIALLNQHGFKLAIITNQSGLSRGYYNENTLTSIHHKMHRLTKAKGGEIDSIYYCPHNPLDNCQCRKPKPGLLKTFARDKNISLSDIYFVGDKLSDIKAAEAAGAKPILVKTGYGKKTITDNPEFEHPIFENLYDAAKFIISET